MTASPTVIVGVDVDDVARAKDAVGLAHQIAATAGAEILLATAVPYAEGPLPGEYLAVQHALLAEAEGRLERLAGSLGATVAVRTVVRAESSPAHLLQDLAEEERAALVVVGPTHAGKLERVIPGSTAERLTHGAPCPVVTTPAAAAAGPIKRIGVAYDASPETRAAVDAGVELAHALGAELEVITVVSAELFGTRALMSGPGYGLIREDLERAAHEHVEQVVAELPSDLHAQPRLLAGDPADQLAHCSRQLDLLIAGSRGYGPLRAVLLGGVTGRLIRLAGCPLLITPRGIERPLASLFDAAAANAGTA